MHLLLSPNDEDMVLLNPLTLCNLPTPRRSSWTWEEEEDRRGVEGSRVVEGSRGRGSPRGRERFPSVKVLKKSMPSSLAGSNQGMLVRSSAKLFWNGVPDRIIRLLVWIQQRPSKQRYSEGSFWTLYQKANYPIWDSIPEQLWRASYHHAHVTFA